MSDEIRKPARVECPICGHRMEFVLEKKATLQALDDMNWKKRVKNILVKHRLCTDRCVHGDKVACVNNIIEELGL